METPVKRPCQLLQPARRWAALLVSLVLLVSAACLAVVPSTARAAVGDLVRGTVTSELALYDGTGEGAQVVRTLSVGTTFQATEAEDGWFTAVSDGTTVYFRGEDAFARYTATNSDVVKAAVLAAGLTVYVAPSTSSEVLSTFSAGATIQFCVFNDEFYMARLASGTICYIPSASVCLYNPSQTGTLTRWAGENGVNVYRAPDTGSSVVTTFDAGRQLAFADFNENWLMASLTVDGTKTTVFVPKSQVTETEPVASEPEVPTTWIVVTADDGLYGRVDTDWNAERTQLFRKGTVLTGRSTGTGWYEVLYNGVTSYLKADYVSEISSSQYTVNYKNYNLTLAQAVALENNGDWVVSNGSAWVKADAATLTTYMNPGNYPAGTSGFFQFMVLTQPLGVSVGELNAQLSGKGILEGQGQAFSDAAYAYNVNEAYLVSHALHETGNGTSRLAMGLWYDPELETESTDENGETVKVKTGGVVDEPTETSVLVYNMYGYGAVDSDPINGGARYAYNQGWTTPYAAIVGGAKLIASGYLSANATTLSGQNTLYKMLYHVEWMATYGNKPWHQYATDVNWANAQTYYLTQLLADYTNYSLVFEVPVYAG
jgi:beta-N-acetylglucosaminidase